MALQSLNAASTYPRHQTASATAAAALGSLDSLTTAGTYPTGHRTVVVCTAPQDMVVSHVGFKATTATGSPTAHIRIETVTAATGINSGTLWAANTELDPTATVTTTFTLHALTASATITKGQQFAVVIHLKTGTALTVGNLANLHQTVGMPYRITNISGSDVKAAYFGANICLGSSTSAFYWIDGFFPTASVSANSFNNTNSAKKCARFILPHKALAVGVVDYQGTAVGDRVWRIEDDAGNELSSSSTAFEGDISSALGSANQRLYFDNTVTLTAGVAYRLVMEPSSSTNCNFYTATLPNANYRTAWPGGTNWFYGTWSTAAGSVWVDTTTDQVPLIDLLTMQLDDGVSTGGAKVIGG